MKGIKFSVKFIAVNTTRGWSNFNWLVSINGQEFEYSMGSAHCTKVYNKNGSRNIKPANSILGEFDGDKVWFHAPELLEVIECLISEFDLGDSSFDNFCGDLGLSNNSISAFDTYRDCMSNGIKLVKAIGRDRINEMREIISEGY